MSDLHLGNFSTEKNTFAQSVGPGFSIIIPAYNEENAIQETILSLTEHHAKEKNCEIIIVNDGSTDRTGEILDEWLELHPGSVNVIHHKSNRGYGAALKTGLRASKSELIVITDSDGTYPNDRIPDLVNTITKRKAAMVIGSRTGEMVEYSKIRSIPKIFLKAYISWIVRTNVPDFNSGLRVFKRSIAEKFFGILPEGFSFTTTLTLAMMTNHYPVFFLPINYSHRIGKSKIHPVKDTVRFVQLIVRTAMYFAPLRVMGPIALLLFLASLVSLGIDLWNKDLTESTLILFMFSLNTTIFAMIADMIDKRTPK